MASGLSERLARRWPIDRWRGLTIVLGCSGGADSTALALAMSQLKPVDTTIVLAHCNHRLRSRESDLDQDFVTDLAEQLGFVFVTNPTDAEPQKVDRPSDEATLRELRYRFLEQTAKRYGARYVAVAHTADDSVETTLHNLVRGTGLNGLTGIAPFRDLNADLVLVRPLIDVWRRDVLKFLEQYRQGYRLDSSNASSEYTRNRIRQRWLPMLEEDVEGDVRQAILRSSSILNDLRTWLEYQANDWLDRHVIRRQPHRIELRGDLTIDVEWPVVQQALTLLWQQQAWPRMAIAYDHWHHIRQLVQSTSGKFTSIELPARIVIRRTDDRIIIEALNSNLKAQKNETATGLPRLCQPNSSRSDEPG